MTVRVFLADAFSNDHPDESYISHSVVLMRLTG